MQAPSTLSFFLPGEPELSRLRKLDPDAEPAEFQTAERAWTLQTYHRLYRRGLPVEITASLPDRGVVVYHAKHKHLVQRQRRRSSQLLLVALRGDRNPVLTADFEILQNPALADGKRSFAMPHWPQPGLLPRDPGRGSRLEKVAYKGFAGNLAADFQGEAWSRELAALGLEWICDSAPFDRRSQRRYPVDWSFFREIDALVAVRPPSGDLHPGKPASKLINAWLAGVPALLGPESAFRQLRRSELDYLEVTHAGEALAALRWLRDRPERMLAMIANGAVRAAEFRQEQLTERWRQLLFEELPARAENPPYRRYSVATLTVASWLRRLGPLPLS